MCVHIYVRISYAFRALLLFVSPLPPIPPSCPPFLRPYWEDPEGEAAHNGLEENVGYVPGKGGREGGREGGMMGRLGGR